MPLAILWGDEVRASGDYYGDVVATTNPSSWVALAKQNPAANYNGTCANSMDQFAESAPNTSPWKGRSYCGASPAHLAVDDSISPTPQDSVNPKSLHAYGLVLVQVPLIPNSDAGSGAAYAVSQWVNTWTKSGAIWQVEGDATGAPFIHVSSDQSQITYGLRGTAEHTSSWGRNGQWHMVTLLYTGSSSLPAYSGYANVNQVQFFVDGARWHTLTGVPTPTYGNGQFQGCEDGHCYGWGQWVDGPAVQLIGEASDPPTKPDCYDSGGVSSLCESRVQLMYDFAHLSVPGKPSCTYDANGKATCGTAGPGDQPPAPLSGSVLKFQLGYLPIVDCGTPPSWNPIDWVPYLACRLENAIRYGINALLFAANVFIDLILPDGSGLAWVSQLGGLLQTRAPFSWIGGTVTAMGSAFNAGAAHPTWAWAPTGGPVMEVDLVAWLAPLGTTILFGLRGGDIIGVAFVVGVSLDIYSRVRGLVGASPGPADV